METACYIGFEYSTYYKNWQYIIKIRENNSFGLKLDFINMI